MQCSESVTFWCGSGSAYPYHWITHPDSNPVLFFSGSKDAYLFTSVFWNNKLFWSYNVVEINAFRIFWLVHDRARIRIRSWIRIRIRTNNGGSGSRFGRPYNFRIRIWIPNTGIYMRSASREISAKWCKTNLISACAKIKRPRLSTMGIRSCRVISM